MKGDITVLVVVLKYRTVGLAVRNAGDVLYFVAQKVMNQLLRHISVGILSKKRYVKFFFKFKSKDLNGCEKQNT